jgi:valyl-tRNA synthetase
MLAKAYDAQQHENNTYKLWESSGVFQPVNNKKGTHINILPPPNANGSLHLGHASGYTIMDIAGRFARMNGKETLLLPGKDHAGILTQTVFEKKLLAEEGIDRYDLGRETFHKRCYDFCIDSAEIMRAQEKRIGLSADWSREKFTLDPEISEEVLDTFVKMYDEGIIYKGSRIINWCPHCQTALSDMEVENEETQGKIWDLHYPLTDGSGEIVVATTRPETMLGDTAVAVHPDDERYQNLIGATVTLPIVGREIIIVADDEIDMNFGSGAVKITPAHDPLDYQIGKRNNLEEIQVIGLDGKMTEEAGSDFAGLTTIEARDKVVAEFESLGLLGKVKDHTKPLSTHDRCGHVIEPLISEQWWMNTDHESFSLKEESLKAVREGKINIVPKHFEKTFFHWMENLQDWCISRQLWWGHQIPAWYKGEEMKVQKKCPGEGWVQDEDSLDTWFSSGQWAHNTVCTFGEDAYFPGDLMVMGRDILFFWACRMIMMSLYSKQEVPFKNLYLTGLITDRNGKKMSKSKGNGIDPLEMADKYGTDALRLSLFIGNTPGNDMRLYEEKIEGYRNFVNKLWNASRFVQMNLENADTTAKEYSDADKWILSRINKLTAEVTQSIESYRYSESGQKLYDFTWNEFCDWYLELSKGDKLNPEVLTTVLATLLKLLHPFVPFVTEVLWKELNLGEGLLAQAEWPTTNKDWDFPEAESNIELLVEIIGSIRSLRSESKVDPVKKIEAVIITNNESNIAVNNFADEIAKMARLEKLEIGIDLTKPEQTVSSFISGGIQIHLPLAGMVNLADEKKRLEKELEAAQKQLSNLEGRLGNEKYVNSAPAALVEQTRAQKVETEEKVETLEEQIKKI